MQAIQRHNPGTRFSEASVHNGTVYLARLCADDTTHGTAGQTRQVLAAIDKALAAAGSDKTRILLAQIFLTDMADFAEMNTVWDAWVPQGHLPSRATFQSVLAKPGWRIEIVVTAAQK